MLIGLPISQAGTTHGFVVEFESAEDRDYYVFKDPTHIAFTKVAGEVLANVIVVDFNPRLFRDCKNLSEQMEMSVVMTKHSWRK